MYAVDLEALVHLDDLEDHPTWYKRMPCAVILSNSDELECEAYFLMNSKPELMQLMLYDEYTLDHAKGYSERLIVPRVSSLKSQVQIT